MSTTTPNRLISRVNRLVNQADTESSLEERLARADQIMATHQLEDAGNRVMQKRDDRRKPEVVDATEHIGSDPRMHRLADRVARTVGVRLVHHQRRLFLVGFQEDVAWAQQLFNGIERMFSYYLEPEWEPDRDFVLNLAVLRESGLSWSQILDCAVEAGAVEDTWSDVPDTVDKRTGRTWGSQKARWSAEDKLNLAYRNWCRETGREPVLIRRHTEYRQAYPDVVARLVRNFLTQLEAARHADETSAAAMLLKGVEEEIEEAVKGLTQSAPSRQPRRVVHQRHRVTAH